MTLVIFCQNSPLVFLDSHVEVTKGWLEALIGPILKGEFIFSKLKCHSLYAQQKTAETITNKTTKTFVKKSSLTKIFGACAPGSDNPEPSHGFNMYMFF